MSRSGPEDFGFRFPSESIELTCGTGKRKLPVLSETSSGCHRGFGGLGATAGLPSSATLRRKFTAGQASSGTRQIHIDARMSEMLLL
jgi:hypothetical protein